MQQNEASGQCHEIRGGKIPHPSHTKSYLYRQLKDPTTSTGRPPIMGAEQSRVSGQQTKFAFHVLRVDEHSPAARAMLVPYFDYIVSVNGVEIVRPRDGAR